jgi:hypothetical protein
MQDLESKREERRDYKITREFVAYVSEGLAPTYISEGAIIIADPEHWSGWKWNGRETLRFFFERNQYYVDRKTFFNVAEAIN